MANQMTHIHISKSELHLAAFIKAGGADFLDFKDGFFVFFSDKSELEWRVQHSNSESLRVDRELFTLKKFFK
jgi:hypothetical protein